MELREVGMVEGCRYSTRQSSSLGVVVRFCKDMQFGHKLCQWPCHGVHLRHLGVAQSKNDHVVAALPLLESFNELSLNVPLMGIL